MSEIWKPQQEQPWEEPVKVLQKFKGGIDELFRDNFDDVDRGMVWNNSLPERLTLQGKNKTKLTLVRMIDTESGENTDYGLHLHENGDDYLYRIQFGLVHKLAPTRDEMTYLLDIHNFAARNDPEKLDDRPVTLKDIERTMKIAKEAKIPDLTFMELIKPYQSEIDYSLQDEFNQEDYNYTNIDVEDDSEEYDPEEDDALGQKEMEYAAMAADYFDSSIDEILHEKADEVKSFNDTEELTIIKQKGDDELFINISKISSDYAIDRVVSIAYTTTDMPRTYVAFHTENGLLQGSKMSDDSEDASNVFHADLDPNAARDLIKFIRNPKIKPEEK